ncbi:MAG: three-Cys-motif partner protein TcmP [Deltaproteobacteria bacterium]|nr:three-Cys-motif partner protein TcmP [Deltaproteobacteria bacterium]
MADRLPTIWKIDPHTQAKHIILKRYLDAWLPIMTRWHGRVLYIDGFAGPGKYQEGEDGSPIIALKSALHHKASLKAELVFLFVEAVSERYLHLDGLVKEMPLPRNFTAKTIHGKFDETVTGLLNYVDEQKVRLAPAFVFIDPFGFSHTPFTLIQRFMTNPRCEVLITFMYEAINRFIDHPELPETYDALFGTNKWREVVSETNPAERRRRIHDIYKNQLEAPAGIKYIRSFEMIDSGNHTEYFLFFGTNSLTGLQKMKAAMWDVDKGGRFQFSDATANPNQPLLFEAEPNYALLKKELLGNFMGKEVSVEEIEGFVLASTPFRETHFKRQILKPMEEARPPQLKVILAKPGRKRGNFPEGTRVKFL